MLLTLACGSTGSDENEDFYRGKSLRILTSNSPGGGFDFYMRATARAIERTSGLQVTALNVEGAGGTLGDNRLYFSRADGLTIGLINFPGHVFAQLRHHPGVQYDFRKWKWLGRVAGIPPAVAVPATSRFQSIQGMIDSAQPVRFGLEGRGSDAYYGVVFLSNVLQIDATKIVGYSGPGEIAGAMLVGEVDARFESIDTLLPQVRQNELRILLLLDTEADPRLPEVPVIGDLDQSPTVQERLEAFANIYKLERSFVVTAETPDSRVSQLRRILWEAWQDPRFQDELSAAGRGLQLMEGEELESEAEKVAAQIEILARLLEEDQTSR